MFMMNNLHIIDEYNSGFFINELFEWKFSGINISKNNIFFNSTDLSDKLQKISCKPFDERLVKTEELIKLEAGRELIRNFTGKDNAALIIKSQSASDNRFSAFATNKIVTADFFVREANEDNYIFPIYVYRNNDEPEFSRTHNFHSEIIKNIAAGLGLQFVPEKVVGNVCYVNNNEDLRDEFKQVFLPIDLFDYIYAVLYSKSYRKESSYKGKPDFPGIPYPHDSGIFWKLVKIGGSLRQVHLLEYQAVENLITQYPVNGDNVVIDPVYKNGNVYINSKQYFANIPEEVWNFYVGTNQPGQEWLLTRKGKYLSDEEIQKYQQIIVALSETRRLIEKAGDLLF